MSTTAGTRAITDAKIAETSPSSIGVAYARYLQAVPACLASAVVHMGIVIILASLTVSQYRPRSVVRINTRLDQQRQVPQFSQVLDELTEPTTDLTPVFAARGASANRGAGSGQGNSGASLSDGLADKKVDEHRIPELRVAARPGNGIIPDRGKLDLRLNVKGEEAVVEGHQDVVERITREILRMLSERKVLLIWMFDESLSIEDDREDIGARFDKIYEELKLSGSLRDDALLTAILSFGKDLHVQTKVPTSDLQVIRQAIATIPLDESGEEWPCKYVIEVGRQYAKYFTMGRRTVALVIVTDESGERARGKRKQGDGDYLEQAVSAARQIRMPVYVVGRQAVFGYPYAYQSYVDQETGDRYRAGITRGPESADFECLQTDGLHFRYDKLSSGFGPYDLVRLARDTGGIYFMLPAEDVPVDEKNYDSLVMKEYGPEYDSRSAYIQRRDASPLRRAVYHVVKATEKMRVHLEFPIEPEQLRQKAKEAYVQARTNRETLAAAYDYLKKSGEYRDREPSRRWRAHYDLMLGQIFVHQVRLWEYEYFLYAFVGKPRVPKYKPDDKYKVAWRVQYNRERSWAPEEYTKEPRELAKRLLAQVIERHPGTPWAERAGLELARGFSVDFRAVRHSRLYEQRMKLVPKF